jgi:hypothetical protein
METTSRDDLAKRHLAEAVVDKTWEVPAYEGLGPVTMTLRLPEVKITDSEGRYIIISPRQSDLVSVRMAGISEWLRYGDEDFVDQTLPEDAEEAPDQQ